MTFSTLFFEFNVIDENLKLTKIAEFSCKLITIVKTVCVKLTTLFLKL